MLIKNNIIQYLKNAILSGKSEEFIFSYYQEVNLKKEWKNLVSHKKQIFHINYPDNTGYIGFGICKAYNIKSKNDLRKLISKKLNYQTYGDKKKISLKLFGGVSFNFRKKSNTIWSDTPKSLFYLPELLLVRDKDNYYLSFNKILNKNSDLNKIHLEYENYIREINDFNHKNYNNDISFSIDNPDRIEYEKNFNSYLTNIKSKNIEKVILSRSKIFKTKNDINLINNTPESTNFKIKLNDDKYFFGSTPEILIKTYKKKYNTLALAGTLIKNKKNIKNNLLNDKKELKEHQYVVNHIMRVLNPYSSKISFSEKPKILTLKHLYHLSTPISGTLKNKLHIIDLLLKLYPTPAVLGSPKKEALKLILQHETIDRGWYSGCIGWFDLDGNGRFDVAIRSALQHKKTIHFYAGGGILKESNLEKEWDETESKFLQLLSIL
tara:strand:+ start:254 stop:1561 length:1308 start_codon:yes stop_codon:yes gene_type:complete